MTHLSHSFDSELNLLSRCLATNLTDSEEILLLVDDNATNLKVLNEILQGQGYKLLSARDGNSALKVAAKAKPTLALLDIMMPPGIDGFEVCRRMKSDDSTKETSVIFLSALDDTESKVKGLDVGAVDFVTKPFDADEVLARVRVHVTIQRLKREVAAQNYALQRELRVAQELVESARTRVEGVLLGESRAVKELSDAIDEEAQHLEPLLIVGPPGAGEETVARTIHDRSLRRNRAFIHVDCLASGRLNAKELFGSKGALFGLLGGGHRGRWDLAEEGTIFFERVDELPLELQRELATRLQMLTSAAERGTPPSVRVILHCLAQFSGEKTRPGFADELLGHFADRELEIPSLAQRREDIPHLVAHFLKESSRRLGKRVDGLSKRSSRLLQDYSWPGNIDELKGVLNCALVACKSSTLEIDEAFVDSKGKVGQYQLVEKLGAGGMGEVWLAKHRLLARPAAVKLIRSELSTDQTRHENAVARFEREAQATAALESPNTVRLFDYGVTDQGTFYFVMERLRGMDLQVMLKEHGPVPAHRAVHFLYQACGSLAEAHAADLVHRDIKPANLFASCLGLEHDIIKVLDFGIVRAPEETQSQLTEGLVLGTPAYIAPEVALGGDVDGRADVYSLGCVAYELLGGGLVFEVAGAVAMLTSHATKPAPPLCQATDHEVPRALEEIVMGCLSKESSDRPSALELRELLYDLDLPRWSAGEAAEWWKDKLAK